MNKIRPVQFRLLTALVACVVLGVLIWMNISPPFHIGVGSLTKPWPVRGFPRAFILQGLNGETTFNSFALAVDVLFAIAAAAITAFGCEWLFKWRRKPD